MTGVKICGLSTAATVDAAVSIGATHIGFVFFAKSPRNVDPEQARALGGRVTRGVARVGVFVDPADELLDRAVAANLDILQLHGTAASRRASIAARYRLPVWAAAGVASRADVSAAIADASGAELLLFDAKAPSDAALPGGNGVRFDWRVLSGVDPGRDWGLSGGLDAGNVGEAVRSLRPILVDVSSGVEHAPGIKSVAKIRAFIEAVRTA